MSSAKSQIRNQTKRSELEALIYLYEDPDPFVRESVEKKIMELGERCVPLLDEVRFETCDQELRERIENLIHSITFGGLEQEFLNYLENGVNNLSDLETGVLLLARFDDPTLRMDNYKKKLDRIASEIVTKVRYASSQREQMKIVLNHIFEKEKFSGTTDEYFHPDNSCINKVIDRKKGIPISLALIVLFVANRLNLPFYGVNMPMHFLLKFDMDNEMVYIDPFNEGSIISIDQCYFFLKKSGIKPLSSHFEKATSLEMLTRVIRNLLNSYEKAKDKERAGKLQLLLGFIDAMEVKK